MVPLMLFQSTPKSPCCTESCGHPGADNFQTANLPRHQTKRIHGAAAKSSVTASVQMVQMIFILHALPKQRFRRWRRRLFNCAESVGKLNCAFFFFPPAFKILWLWIYFVAKIPTFHLFTVLAPNRSKGHAILVSSLLKSPFFSSVCADC